MGTPVKLYVYDLSGGLSKALSQSLIGRPIEGIWHTAIIVFGREYFFGSSGIKSCEVGGTFLVLHEIVPLGETFVPYSLFKEYIEGLSQSTFTGASYDLLNHNCNNFSDEVAQFLCGVRIPKHILDLPDIIRETPVGSALLGLIEAITPANRRNSREDSPDYLQLNLDIEEGLIKDSGLCYEDVSCLKNYGIPSGPEVPLRGVVVLLGNEVYMKERKTLFSGITN